MLSLNHMIHTYLATAGSNYLKLLPCYLVLELVIILWCSRGGKRVPLGFVFGLQALAFLMTFLLVITGQSGIFDLLHYDHSLARPDQLNLIPFKRAHQDRFGFIMNLFAFLPFGLLLPLLWQSFTKWYKTVAAGFFLSLTIEISQLFNMRATDVDDLIMNTAGTLVGYLLYCIFCKGIKGSFQLENVSGNGRGIRKSGGYFIIGVFLCSYLLRPLVNHFL